MPFDFRAQQTISGIYQIKNLINGRIYIGSAKNINKRKIQHFCNLNKNKHSNKFLQNDFNKHGKENFSFEMLETAEQQNLIFYEQKYLNKFYDNQIKCYNMCPNAYNTLGKKLTQEHKNKISQSNKGKNIGNKNGMFGKTGNLSPSFGRTPWKNKNHSNESKEKMSKYWKEKFSIPENCPMYGKSNKWGHHKPEIREKIIKNLKNFSKKIIQIDKNTKNEIKIFDSITQASIILKISRSSINSCLRGRSKSAGGYMWKYMGNV